MFGFFKTKTTDEREKDRQDLADLIFLHDQIIELWLNPNNTSAKKAILKAFKVLGLKEYYYNGLDVRMDNSGDIVTRDHLKKLLTI